MNQFPLKASLFYSVLLFAIFPILACSNTPKDQPSPEVKTPSEEQSLLAILQSENDRNSVDEKAAALRKLIQQYKKTSFSTFEIYAAQMPNCSIERLQFPVKAKLPDSNFSHANLSSVSLEKGRLPYCNLYSSILDHANLTEADLFGANLSLSNLNSTNLQGSDLGTANLSKAKLHGAKLQQANLNGANLSEAKLVEVDMTEASLKKSNLSLASFKSCNLSNTILESANCTQASFENCNLGHSNLTECNLEQANLKNVDLTNATLKGCQLVDANWEEVQGFDFRNLSQEQSVQVLAPNQTGWSAEDHLNYHEKHKSKCIAEAKLLSEIEYKQNQKKLRAQNKQLRLVLSQKTKGAAGEWLPSYQVSDRSLAMKALLALHKDLNWEEFKLEEIQLEDCDLAGIAIPKGAELSHSNLKRCNLSKATLERVQLSQSDLSNCILVQANLIRTNLRGSNLSGADLWGADLQGASLSSANLMDCSWTLVQNFPLTHLSLDQRLHVFAPLDPSWDAQAHADWHEDQKTKCKYAVALKEILENEDEK